MNQAKYVFYADGGVGKERAGAGLLICEVGGPWLQIYSRPLPLMSSNEAEYQALLLALDLGRPYAAHRIDLCLDSEVVVYQMLGRFAVNSPKLKTLHRQACEAARAFLQLRYTRIPRTANRLADALAAEAAAGRPGNLKGGA
jgi:ribonuclease HI